MSNGQTDTIRMPTEEEWASVGITSRKGRVKLTPEDEELFQEFWDNNYAVKVWKEELGNTNKSPDDPKEKFDYRKAWLQGDYPQPVKYKDGTEHLHWGSGGKDFDHPTANKSVPFKPLDEIRMPTEEEWASVGITPPERYSRAEILANNMFRNTAGLDIGGVGSQLGETVHLKEHPHFTGRVSYLSDYKKPLERLEDDLAKQVSHYGNMLIEPAKKLVKSLKQLTSYSILDTVNPDMAERKRANPIAGAIGTVTNTAHTLFSPISTAFVAAGDALRKMDNLEIGGWRFAGSEIADAIDLPFQFLAQAPYEGEKLLDEVFKFTGLESLAGAPENEFVREIQKNLQDFNSLAFTLTGLGIWHRGAKAGKQMLSKEQPTIQELDALGRQAYLQAIKSDPDIFMRDKKAAELEALGFFDVPTKVKYPTPAMSKNLLIAKILESARKHQKEGGVNKSQASAVERITKQLEGNELIDPRILAETADKVRNKEYQLQLEQLYNEVVKHNQNIRDKGKLKDITADFEKRLKINEEIDPRSLLDQARDLNTEGYEREIENLYDKINRHNEEVRARKQGESPTYKERDLPLNAEDRLKGVIKPEETKPVEGLTRESEFFEGKGTIPIESERNLIHYPPYRVEQIRKEFGSGEKFYNEVERVAREAFIDGTDRAVIGEFLTEAGYRKAKAGKYAGKFRRPKFKKSTKPKAKKEKKAEAPKKERQPFRSKQPEPKKPPIQDYIDRFFEVRETRDNLPNKTAADSKRYNKDMSKIAQELKDSHPEIEVRSSGGKLFINGEEVQKPQLKQKKRADIKKDVEVTDKQAQAPFDKLSEHDRDVQKELSKYVEPEDLPFGVADKTLEKGIKDINKGNELSKEAQIVRQAALKKLKEGHKDKTSGELVSPEKIKEQVEDAIAERFDFGANVKEKTKQQKAVDQVTGNIKKEGDTITKTYDTSAGTVIEYKKKGKVRGSRSYTVLPDGTVKEGVFGIKEGAKKEAPTKRIGRTPTPTLTGKKNVLKEKGMTQKKRFDEVTTRLEKQDHVLDYYWENDKGGIVIEYRFKSDIGKSNQKRHITILSDGTALAAKVGEPPKGRRKQFTVADKIQAHGRATKGELTTGQKKSLKKLRTQAANVWVNPNKNPDGSVRIELTSSGKKRKEVTILPSGEIVKSPKRTFSEENFNKDIKDMFDDVSGGFIPNPKAFKAGVRAGAYVLEDVIRAGARKSQQFYQWSTEMTKRFGQKVKPHLLKIWKGIKEAYGKKLIEIAEKLPIARAGMKGLMDASMAEFNKGLDKAQEKYSPRMDKKTAEFEAKTPADGKGKKVTKYEGTIIKEKIAMFKQGHKAGKLDLKELQKMVYSFAKKELPKYGMSRGQVRPLLNKTIEAKTIADVEKLFQRIEGMRENVYKKRYRLGIVQTLNKFLPKRDKLTKRKEGKKMTAEFYKYTVAFKDALSKSKLEAQDEIAAIHEKAVIKNRPLSKKENRQVIALSYFGGFKDKTAGELAQTWELLDKLTTYGTKYLKAKRLQEKARIAEVIEKTIAEIAPKGLLGKEAAHKLSDKHGILTKLNNFDTSMQSLEWLLQKLTNKKTEKALGGYLNTYHYTNVKKARLAENYGLRKSYDLLNKNAERIFGKKKGKLKRYFDKLTKQFDDTGIRVKDKTDKDGNPVYEDMRISLGEAGKLWMEYQDPTLRKTLHDTHGWTDKTYDQLEAFIKKHDPKIIDWAKWQLFEFYPKYYEGVNKVYESMYNTSLDFNPYYSPIRREMKLEISDKMLNSTSEVAGVVNSGLMARVMNILGLKRQDMNQSLLNHIIQMEHFKAWAHPMRELRSVFGNTKVQNAIKQTKYGGEFKLQVLMSFLNDLARGGSDRGKIVKWVDRVRQNFTTAVIGGNPVVFAKQLASIPAYAIDIPTIHFINGMKDVANPAMWPKIYETLSSSEMFIARYRMGHERDVILAMGRTSSQTMANMKSFRDWAMMSTKGGDAAAILAGGWSVYKYHYGKNIKKGMGKDAAHKSAITEFERTTERMQQAGNVEDLAFLQSQGSYNKLFTMFMTSKNQYYRSMSGAVRMLAKGQGKPIDNVKRLVVAHFVLPMLFQFVADGFRWKDENQIRAGVLGSFNGLMIAGDILEAFSHAASPILNKQINKAIGTELSTKPADRHKTVGSVPVLQPAEHGWSAIDKIARVGDTLTFEEIREITHELLRATSKGVGVPYDPAVKLLSGWKETYKGETDYPVRRSLGFSRYMLGEDQLKKKKKKSSRLKSRSSGRTKSRLKER